MKYVLLIIFDQYTFLKFIPVVDWYKEIGHWVKLGTNTPTPLYVKTCTCLHLHA